MRPTLSLIIAALAMLTMGMTASAQEPPIPFPRVVGPDPAPPPVVSRPLTIHEFARSFRPLPGKYEVLFCHPYSGKPVKVCFELPPGCIKVVLRKKLLCYEIDFDYGRKEIEINFGKRGRTKIFYNN